MKPIDEERKEIFAFWEYDSYEDYVEMENKIRSDIDHVNKVQKWDDENGGREKVITKYILQVKNELLISDCF